MTFKSFGAWIIALAGLNFVVLIHEAGHFLACKFFSVATPVFSIGFGPKLIGMQIGSTLFQLAALPLGGYVAINEAQLMAQPYFAQMIVLIAGIITNILFALLVFFTFRFSGISYHHLVHEAMQDFKGGFIGPVGILTIIHRSVLRSAASCIAVLALLSTSIALFNLLPIPFLDGGQIVGYTLHALFGAFPPMLSNAIEFIVMIIFIVLFVMFAVRDVRQLRDE